MLSKWTQAWQKGSTELGKHISAVPEVVKSGVPAIQSRIRNVDLRGLYQYYDKLTGLDQVRSAHELVVMTEKNFVDRQLERRTCQTECFLLEEARNRVNIQLDGVSRSDENFLKLVTELHDLSRRHKESRDRLSAVELAEQVAFENFSSALRRSQAEERVQANRMRQWSIWMSVVAGTVGFGATWLRYHNSQHSASSSNPEDLLASLATTVDEKLSPVVHALNDSVEELKRITSQAQLCPPTSDRLSPQLNDDEPHQSKTSGWQSWIPSPKTSLVAAGSIAGTVILVLLLL